MILFAEDPKETEEQPIRFTVAELYALQVAVRRTRGRSYEDRRKLLLSVLNKIEKLAEKQAGLPAPANSRRA